MRIESLTAAMIKPLSNAEVTDLRARFLRLYDHYYHDPQFVEKKNPLLSTLSRRTFIEKYVLLRKELKRRALCLYSNKALDGEVNERLAKAAVVGIDVPELGDIVLASDYVVLTGPFLRSPKSAEQVDLVIAGPGRDEATELRVGVAVKDVLGKQVAFAYRADGQGEVGTHIPLFDLVLRAKSETVRVEGLGQKKVAKKLSADDAADFEKESEAIRVNRTTAAAQKPHKFRAAKWTHPNGHPRCLLCGDEERTGNICAGAKAEKAAGPTEIKKPEVTETLVRIPVRGKVEGHEIRTIPISEKDGISALEDVTDKAIVTYLFDKEKWTMAAAHAWIEEHGGKAAGATTARFIEFVKVDKAQQLVGGIVYEPDVVDTQGDFATAEDIQKAMYRFMEKYSTQTARIKVMHEGESHTFPIIECVQPEEDIVKGGKVVKKGSWWIMVKITHDAVWKAIDEGRLNGFSMGGRARGREALAPTP
jgi:hypothetical protein